MIKFHRLLLSLTYLFLPLQVFAEAPVVDDSENFAILDEQQAAIVQPVAKAQLMKIVMRKLLSRTIIRTVAP